MRINTKKYYSDPAVCPEDLKKVYVTDYNPYRECTPKKDLSLATPVGHSPTTLRSWADLYPDTKKEVVKKILT